MPSYMTIPRANVTRVQASQDGAKLYVNLTDGESEFTFTALPSLRSVLSDALLMPRKLTMEIEGRLYAGDRGDRQVLSLVNFASAEIEPPKNK